MTSYQISVDGAQVEVVERTGILTEDMVGATVELLFDGAWDGLTRLIVFKAGRISRDQVYTGGPVEIPYEVLVRPGSLMIGVYGYDHEKRLVLPTEPVLLDKIRQGTKPSGSVGGKYTPSAVEQMMALVQAALKVAEDARASAAAAQKATEDAVKLITENIATDDQVQQILDEVFALEESPGENLEDTPGETDDPSEEETPVEGGEVATDEEVNDLLDDIFGSMP